MKQSKVLIYLKACPCHTDCVEGCQFCSNPICKKAILTLEPNVWGTGKAVLIQENGIFHFNVPE